MKLYHVGILGAGFSLLIMIGQAPSIRTLNPAFIYASKDFLLSIKDGANKTLDKDIAFKKKQLEKSATSQPDTVFCSPEFDPVPMTEITKLAGKSKKDITSIKNQLGIPCKEDKNAIYYSTDNGRIVGYDKGTGTGFYKQ